MVKWSSRRPVKPEVAGSNPVGTARGCREAASLLVWRRIADVTGIGRVAQLAERPPEKRKVTGSTPVSTTTGTSGCLSRVGGFLEFAHDAHR